MSLPDFDDSHPVPSDVIGDQERHAEIARGMEAAGTTDEIHGEASARGRGTWVAVLLASLGIIGIFVLAYWILTFLLGW